MICLGTILRWHIRDDWNFRGDYSHSRDHQRYKGEWMPSQDRDGNNNSTLRGRSRELRLLLHVKGRNLAANRGIDDLLDLGQGRIRDHNILCESYPEASI